MEYMRHLKRAEHALTTHLLCRTQWRERSSDFLGSLYIRSWEQVGHAMIGWMIGVCQNLETLVMDFPVKRSLVKDVLHSCPHLKHLVIGLNTGDWHHSDPGAV